MREKHSVSATVLGYVVLAVIFTTFFALLVSLSYATEAPGCGNQHYRPRLSQCCPRYLAGDTLPPKCAAPLRDGFLAQCCGGPTPVLTPTPDATCPEGWRCWPTPQATSTYAIVMDKASCCRHVRMLYTEARYAIVAQARAEIRDLIAWRKQAMRQCREEHSR